MDLISRQAAIDAMTNTLWHYPNECYRNLNEYEFAKGLSELGLKSVPSAQPMAVNVLKRSETPNSSDVISRQAAIDAIARSNLLTAGAMLDCKRKIEKLPSAQSERKTGEWSVEFSPAYKGGAYCECSQCNYKFAMGAYFEPDEWKFCPNCGAKMEVEDETD